MPQVGGSAKGASTTKAILRELQDIRESLEIIEQRSKYLKPPGAVKKAGMDIISGIFRAIGIFIGSVILIGALVFVLQRVVSSPQFQNFLGEQVENTVENVVEEQSSRFPIPLFGPNE